MRFFKTTHNINHAGLAKQIWDRQGVNDIPFDTTHMRMKDYHSIVDELEQLSHADQFGLNKFNKCKDLLYNHIAPQILAKDLAQNQHLRSNLKYLIDLTSLQVEGLKNHLKKELKNTTRMKYTLELLDIICNEDNQSLYQALRAKKGFRSMFTGSNPLWTNIRRQFGEAAVKLAEGRGEIDLGSKKAMVTTAQANQEKHENVQFQELNAIKDFEILQGYRIHTLHDETFKSRIDHLKLAVPEDAQRKLKEPGHNNWM